MSSYIIIFVVVVVFCRDLYLLSIHSTLTPTHVWFVRKEYLDLGQLNLMRVRGKRGKFQFILLPFYCCSLSFQSSPCHSHVIALIESQHKIHTHGKFPYWHKVNRIESSNICEVSHCSLLPSILFWFLRTLSHENMTWHDRRSHIPHKWRKYVLKSTISSGDERRWEKNELFFSNLFMKFPLFLPFEILLPPF